MTSVYTLHHNLIVEYRLLVNSVAVGRGKCLFRDGSDRTALRLVDSDMFGSNVVLPCYQPYHKE